MEYDEILNKLADAISETVKKMIDEKPDEIEHIFMVTRSNVSFKLTKQIAERLDK